VAISVIGIKGRKRFVLNVVNKHLDAAATEAEIRRQREVHRPLGAVLVEDKANGPAVIQGLKLNVPGVIEINPQGGKIARMFAVAAEWQGRRLAPGSACGVDCGLYRPNNDVSERQKRRYVRFHVAGGGLAVTEGRPGCQDLQRVHRGTVS